MKIKKTQIYTASQKISKTNLKVSKNKKINLEQLIMKTKITERWKKSLRLQQRKIKKSGTHIRNCGNTIIKNAMTQDLPSISSQAF